MFFSRFTQNLPTNRQKIYYRQKARAICLQTNAKPSGFHHLSRPVTPINELLFSVSSMQNVKPTTAGTNNAARKDKKNRALNCARNYMEDYIFFCNIFHQKPPIFFQKYSGFSEKYLSSFLRTSTLSKISSDGIRNIGSPSTQGHTRWPKPMAGLSPGTRMPIRQTMH